MKYISEERLRELFEEYQHRFLSSQLEKMYEPHAVMNTLHALLDECQELSQWQPIESAPKDRKVLLYYRDRGIFVGKWDNDEYSKKPRPYWASDFSRLWGKNYARGEQPIFWLPLPPGPELPEQSSGN